MRTTVNLEPDVAAGVAALRRTEGLSLSKAVNVLARGGLARSATPQAAGAFTQRSANLGLLIDVSNTAEALEYLEGPTHP
jgi:hypothetical protein